MDTYTQMSEAATARPHHVEHVVEIQVRFHSHSNQRGQWIKCPKAHNIINTQMIVHAWKATVDKMSSDQHKIQEKDLAIACIKTIVNNIKNLNVTSSAINNAKKKAVKGFLAEWSKRGGPDAAGVPSLMSYFNPVTFPEGANRRLIVATMEKSAKWIVDELRENADEEPKIQIYLTNMANILKGMVK